MYVGMENIESATGRLVGEVRRQAVQSSTFSFDNRHVLYGRLRPYLNKVYLPDFSGHCSTEIFPLRPGEQLDRRFLFYWLIQSSTVDAIDRTCTGARMPRANVDALMRFDFPLPSLPEQRRIVAILDEAFAAIGKAMENAERNRENAKTLAESMIGDSFRNIAARHPLRDLASLTSKIGSGATPLGGSKTYKKSGTSLIRSMNVYDREFRLEGLAYLDDTQAQRLAIVTVEADDVLFNITGASIARCCTAKHVPLPARVNQHVLILRPRRDAILSDYLCNALTTSLAKRALLGIGDDGGSTRQAITKSQMQQFRIPLPSLDQQRVICREIDQIDQASQRLSGSFRQKITLLHGLKQSLLHHAFTGQLTSKGADRLLAEAV